MKQVRLFLAIFLLAFTCLNMHASSLEENSAPIEDRSDFSLGVGFVFSSDYNDLLDDVYDDVTGGFGWLAFEFGFRQTINEHLIISPSADILLNYAYVDRNFGDDDTYFNSIILPSISARYKFSPELASFYVEGEVNFNIPNTGSDDFDFDSGGIGFGGALGYTFANKMEIEVAYKKIPVDVEIQTTTMTTTVIDRDREENLGGIHFGFRKRF